MATGAASTIGPLDRRADVSAFNTITPDRQIGHRDFGRAQHAGYEAVEWRCIAQERR
jgi:hypothetical protein